MNRIQDIMERVGVIYEQYNRELRPRIEELQYGGRALTDEEFLVWFPLMVEQQGPNWAAALPLVEGGMAELRRYEKLAGYREG